MNLQPKLDFLKSDEAKAFAELAKSPVLRRGIDVALLQFIADLPRPDGLENACRQDYEVHGAKSFIWQLLNLTEAEAAPPKPPTQNLTWQRPPQPQKKPLLRPKQQPPQQ
jgi:hypothetical protein